MRRPSKGHVSHERWLISYADFITLLFAVFVVLYAASAAKKGQNDVSDAIDTAFKALGLFDNSTREPKNAKGSDSQDKPVIPMNIVMGEDVLAPAKVKEDLDKVKRELEQTLSKQVAEHTVSIKMGRDGLVISLKEAGFFASGSASPKPETLPTLKQVAASLGRTPYDLRIEGHTDNIPIHTAEFDSNWESLRPAPPILPASFLPSRPCPPTASLPPVMPNSTRWLRTIRPKAVHRIAASIWLCCRAPRSISPVPACHIKPARGRRLRMTSSSSSDQQILRRMQRKLR